MADKLWELESLTGDAADCLRRALDMTSAFLTDDRTGEPLPWVEMSQTADRLQQALGLLSVALEPIQAAIKAEREYDDHMSDLADGQSY